MPAYWYTLHGHPHKEEALYHQIQMEDVGVFYPCIKVNPVNPRSRKIRPYFPGYLFVHVDLEASGLSVFQWMPYASGLVSFGGEPAVVPDALIFEIQKRVKSINEAGGETLESLVPGETVTIQSGPFAGYEAIFDHRLPGTERVRVLLKMLSQRNVPLELRAGQVQPVKKPRPRP